MIRNPVHYSLVQANSPTPSTRYLCTPCYFAFFFFCQRVQQLFYICVFKHYENTLFLRNFPAGGPMSRFFLISKHFRDDGGK